MKYELNKSYIEKCVLYIEGISQNVKGVLFSPSKTQLQSLNEKKTILYSKEV